MIASLRGLLLDMNSDHVVIETGGVGWQVFVSQNTLRSMPELGKEASLRIHTHLREDAISLFGFATNGEKEAFTLLTAVNGVGPKLALAVLSELTPDLLSRVVYSQDLKALTKVSGIGKKTAERILLELRDKLKLASVTSPPSHSGLALAHTENIGVFDAVEALVALGYARVEAEQAVQSAIADQNGGTTGAGDLVRLALKQLAPPA